MRDTEALKSYLHEHKPSLIVNAAAFSDLDLAEENHDEARMINAVVPETIAQYCDDFDAFFLHYSSDQLFDGNTDRLYTESDSPNPINTFGWTKLEAERAIQNTQCAFCILRVSSVFSRNHPDSFPLKILERARTMDEIRVSRDLVRHPCSDEEIAEKTRMLLDAIYGRGRDFLSSFREVIHFVPEGPVSQHGFATELIRLALQPGRDIDLKLTSPDRVIPISSSLHPTPALRPKNLRLDTTKLRETYDITLEHWYSQLERFFD